MSPKEECLIEEKKMIGFLADRLWTLMSIYELHSYFSDEERDTVNAIRNHFSDHPEYVMLDDGEKEWNKTL